jgi:NAD(P)-dependent dehydrogenase (short-subunit alcohol dehydrogenase family)
MTLEGKTVVITGGGSGIGLAAAQQAIQKGAKVVIAGRNEQKLEAAVAQLGTQARGYRLDVTRQEEIPAFFEQVGAFDHLVTAAAEAGGGTTFSARSIEDARQIFDNKFWGQYYMVKAGLDYLQADGSVTLFSGWISRKPMTGYSTLAAVDAAIEALARVLAIELAPLRVNAVSPGVITTPLWQKLPPERRQARFEELSAHTTLKRVGEADEVAKAILFLIENSFVTGTVIDVDGGAK